MAKKEIIKINIEFTGKPENLITVPETVTVSKESIVQWNIINLQKGFNSKFWPLGLIFTIYFEEKSPFPWNRKFVQIGDNPFLPISDKEIIRLAEDIPVQSGKYKYGVRVESGQSGEELYDEDPYLDVL